MSDVAKDLGIDRDTIASWIDVRRTSFPQGGLWLIGHEPNVQPPSCYDEAELAVLIFRLSPYDSVATSMTHGILGQLSLESHGLYVDYGFMPPRPEGEEMARLGIPPLFGTTSRRPFSDFDVIAFSNSVAQELVNLPWLLEASKISLDGTKRLDDEAVPLLIMGGANAMSAFAACPDQSRSLISLVDALYFGEAEPFWVSMLDMIKKERKAGVNKAGVLNRLSKQFPCLHSSCSVGQKTLGAARKHDLKGMRSLVRGPLWYSDEAYGYGSVAIDAGCPHLCAFCKEAWECRPYRMRPHDDIMRDIADAKMNQGLDTVNLMSFNLTSHKEAPMIIADAHRLVSQVIFKSQRFDHLARNPEIAAFQQLSGKRSFTFGLEGISERIRDFLGKDITENQALEALRNIFTGPLRQVKIFLIFTGRENDSDWGEFSEFLGTLNELRERQRQGFTPIVLSMTPLISMPHTPMQFNPFPSRDAIREGARELSVLGKRHRMITRESATADEALCAQILLFSDGLQGDALRAASKVGRYYREIQAALTEALVSHIDPSWLAWLSGEKGPGDSFPWDALSSIEEKERLYRLYQKAKRALDAPGPAAAPEKSTSRGEPLAGSGPGQGGKLPKDPLPAMMSHNAAFTTCHWFTIRSLPECAGLPLRFFQAALARAMGRAVPAIAEAYWGPGPSYGEPGNLPCWGIGRCSLNFRGDVSTLIPGALEMMEPQWGWSALGHGGVPSHQEPEGFLLRIGMAKDSMHKEEHAFSAMLAGRGIAHQIRWAGGTKAFIVHRKSLKKGGFYHALWDFEKESITFTRQSGSIFETFIAKTAIMKHALGRGKCPEIIGMWSGDPSLRCPVCRAAQFIDPWDGTPLNLCPDLCAMRAEAPTQAS
jgi:radical SAM superfamily enzyme YgiQ (UPF0313 family)